MAVDGDYAAFFVEFVASMASWRVGCRTMTCPGKAACFEAVCVQGRRCPRSIQRDLRCRSRNRFFIVTPMTGASISYFAAIAATCFGMEVEIRMREGLHGRAGTRAAGRWSRSTWRADFGGAEGAFGEGHGETAIAEVVRGFGQAGGNDVAHGDVHALLVVHVERGGRPQSWLRITLAYWVPPKRVSSVSPKTAEKDELRAFAAGRHGDGMRGLHQADDAEDRAWGRCLRPGFRCRG